MFSLSLPVLVHCLLILSFRMVGAKSAPSIAGEVHPDLAQSADQVHIIMLLV